MENEPVVSRKSFPFLEGGNMKIRIGFVKVQKIIMLVPLIEINQESVGIGVFQIRMRKNYKGLQKNGLFSNLMKKPVSIVIVL